MVFNTSNGRVVFSGANNQTLNGSFNYQFKKVTLDKSSNHVTANTTLSVDDSLIFTTGNLITTSTNLLTMKAGSKALGASNASFVDGPVKKVGNTAFVFPVGKGSMQRNIEITAPSGTSDAFTAEFFDQEQTMSTNMDSTIDFIPCNYWSLNRNSGSTNVDVFLSWDSIHCPILDSADLRVSGYNGTVWKDYGYNNFTGNKYLGKLRNNAAITSFSYFSLAYNTTTLPFVILGNDSIVNPDTLQISNVSSYGNLLWYPKADLSCTNCANPIADLSFTRKYYLKATDYKGRIAIDSIKFKVVHPLTVYDYLPPAVDWKATDWIEENPLTGVPTTWDEGGDEWWYGHDVSYSIDPSPAVMNGYICAGYSSAVNTSLVPFETLYNGCSSWVPNPGIDCEAFETTTNKRGVLVTSIALKPLTGKGYIWHKNYASGQFYRVKMTADGGYLACGLTYSTVDPYTGAELPYNITQELSSSICSTAAAIKQSHAYVVKTDSLGVVQWQRIYGHVPLSGMGTTDYFSELYSFVEIPSGGYRLVGRAEYANQAFHDGKPIRTGWILDINEDGDFLNSYVLPDNYSSNSRFENIYPSIITDVVYYEPTGTFAFSGNVDEFIGNYRRNAFVFSVENDFFTPLDIDNQKLWFEVDEFDTWSANETNSANYYLKYYLSGSDVILLFPIIYDCNICAYAGDNFGEGRVYKYNMGDGTLISWASIGQVGAYDLKVDVIPTEEDEGFAALSSKDGFNIRTWTSTSFCSNQPLGYWNTDASVTKFNNQNPPDPLWTIQWDVNDKDPVYYPGDYKKQECLYTLTRAHDGGYVIAGNNSYNFDDYYLCKLQSDCHSIASSNHGFNAFNLDYHITGSNEIWYTNKEILGKVTIDENAKLTIENGVTITFADSRRISDETGHNILTQLIVQPGGELEIKGSSILDVIDSGCEDGMWDGIQVLGQPTLAQNINNQGFVKISEDSYIRNARIGICASEAKYDNKFQYLSSTNLQGAGIVHANGANFENNRVGIWIGPFKRTYSINRILSSDFTSNSILRDPFYKVDDDNPEVLSSFVKLYGSSVFNISANNFTGLNTVDPNYRGNGIECFGCGVNIHAGNSFDDLYYAIKSLYHSLGSTNRMYIADNTFTNNYFSIYDRGGAFHHINRNSFTVPDIFNGLPKPFGIWMHTTRAYLFQQNNISSVSSSGDENLGIILSNSWNSASEVFNNTLVGTTVGTQTEGINNNLRIRCNKYFDHYFSWLINPQSSGGSLNSQGTECQVNGGITAGNEFNDGCVNNVDKNIINSTIEFDYWANGEPSSTFIDLSCASDILSNSTLGEIHNCGSLDEDLLACMEEEPSGNNRLTWLDSLSRQNIPVIRNKLWTSYLSLVILEDSIYQDTIIISYFDSINDPDAKWYKITYYVDQHDTVKIDSLMQNITLLSFEDSIKFQYYEFIRSTMTDENTLYNLSNEQIDVLTEIMTIESQIVKNQSALLENNNYETVQFLPEEVQYSRKSHTDVTLGEQQSKSLYVIPNPNEGNFKVNLSKYYEDSGLIMITNVLGNVVYSEYLSGTNTITLNLNLVPGIYLLTEKSSNLIQSVPFIVTSK